MTLLSNRQPHTCELGAKVRGWVCSEVFLGVKLIGPFGDEPVNLALLTPAQNSCVSLSGTLKLFSYPDSHAVLQMAMLVCQLSESLKLEPRKAWNWGEADAGEEESGVGGLLKTRRQTVRCAVGMKLGGSHICVCVYVYGGGHRCNIYIYICGGGHRCKKSWWTSEPRINIASIYWAPSLRLEIR